MKKYWLHFDQRGQNPKKSSYKCRSENRLLSYLSRMIREGINPAEADFSVLREGTRQKLSTLLSELAEKAEKKPAKTSVEFSNPNAHLEYIGRASWPETSPEVRIVRYLARAMLGEGIDLARVDFSRYTEVSRLRISTLLNTLAQRAEEAGSVA